MTADRHAFDVGARHQTGGVPPSPVPPARGRLGIVQGTALYIASVLGTGLLVLPGLAAEVAGPASIVAVLAVLGLSVPLAGTFAVLASRYPDPGGVASYVRRALGDTAARMTGYWFMFGVCAGAPVVAVLGAEYVTAVAGIDHAMVPVIAAAIFVPPFAVNAFGVRVAGWHPIRAHRAPSRGGGDRRGAGGARRRGAELHALPVPRLGWRRHGDQPLRLGLRGLGGRHAHLGRVPRSAPRHSPRDGDRPRRDRRLLSRPADRDGRRVGWRGRRGAGAAPRARAARLARSRRTRGRDRRGDRGPGCHERLSRRFRQARSIPRPQPRPAALVRERASNRGASLAGRSR